MFTPIDFSNVTLDKIDELYNEYTSFISQSNNKISQLDLNNLSWENVLDEQIKFENINAEKITK